MGETKKQENPNNLKDVFFEFKGTEEEKTNLIREASYKMARMREKEAKLTKKLERLMRDKQTIANNLKKLICQ